MVQEMRAVYRNKKKRNLSVWVLLNLILWGSGIYLWLQDYDPAPIVIERYNNDEVITTSDAIAVHAEIDDTISVDFDYSQIGIHYSNEQDGSEQDYSNEEVGFTLASHHALLINLTTGDVLYAINENDRIYPASITKIMTILVGLEHIYEEEELIVEADFETLYNEQAATAGFEYGERRSLSDVLHGSMLMSGADATSTLAHHVAGSYEGFVDLMNETATRIGLYNTHFTNASGLHDNDHYSTAADIATMLKYALEIEGFREVFTTLAYEFTTSDGDKSVMTSTMLNSMVAIGLPPEFNGGEILGGKDGFTYEAGLCLASLATDGENEFILITLEAPYGTEENLHIVDAFTIYEYFFNLN